MVFPNLGETAPAQHDPARDRQRARRSRRRPPRRAARIARADTTFLVLNMMRSVINEGTGAGRARRRVHARRRRQVGHDQRPARRLVRRVHARTADAWCGWASTTTAPWACSGSQAALPIWTAFMQRALAGPRRTCRSRRRRPVSSSPTSTATPASWPARPARACFASRSWPAPSRTTALRAARLPGALRRPRPRWPGAPGPMRLYFCDRRLSASRPRI